jgi:hypothetical protein
MINRYNYTKVNGKPMLVHRFVMAWHMGRFLTPNEVVHHVDGDSQNNDISNLRLMSHEEHSSLHNKGKRRVRSTWDQRRIMKLESVEKKRKLACDVAI